MSSLRQESHVAQQIRRDKLRIQNLEDFPTNIEHLSLYPGLSSDLLQVRNVRNANMLYEPSFYSPEAVSFSTPSNPLPTVDEPKPHYGSFLHSPDPAMSSGPRDHLGYDWMVNYASGSVVNETSNPNSNFVVTNHYNELMIQPPLYQNTLQDIVKSASAQRSDVASLMQHQQPGNPIWVGNYIQQPNQLHFETANLSGDSVSNPQGLSLSLSSNSQSKLSGFSSGDACGSTKSVMKSSSIVGVSNAGGHRCVGPLGPFTGYATILKSSRFLKPAQELLDVFCGVCGGGTDVVKASDISEGVNASESGVSTKDSVVSNAGGAPSSSLHGSKGDSGDGGARGGFGYSSGPEFQQKKVKLLYMQEEVTRKYKQYHQQMQMVVSSFESVAGLSSATPYVAAALRSVTRNFKCLKGAILDQIKHIREVLGEDLSGSFSGSSSKLDIDIARLRYADQSFQKSKTGFMEPQQQVWRPQRGLPERAVAILKAWLFEHFLHPYPTDTDKHMLASQTGLSRNQVSNWFINARVRVWKPMVEEIHNLETKGSTGGNQNDAGTSAAEACSQQAMVDHEPLNNFNSKHGDGDAIPEKQFQCLEMSFLSGGNLQGGGFISAEQWNQEKRSKLECHQIPSNLDGTLMGFVPYRRGGSGGGGGGVSGFDVAGLGNVSLTLGLRHGVEGVQHQQQQQLQQEEQLRRHFGEHMIHDFVG